jgi:hypothetical protein
MKPRNFIKSAFDALAVVVLVAIALFGRVAVLVLYGAIVAFFGALVSVFFCAVVGAFMALAGI